VPGDPAVLSKPLYLRRFIGAASSEPLYLSRG